MRRERKNSNNNVKSLIFAVELSMWAPRRANKHRNEQRTPRTEEKLRELCARISQLSFIFIILLFLSCYYYSNIIAVNIFARVGCDNCTKRWCAPPCKKGVRHKVHANNKNNIACNGVMMPYIYTPRIWTYPY